VNQLRPFASPRFNRPTAGFTLVEIMIVVVIVGLLAAMAIPAVKRVQVRSVSSRYINDARQIRDAAERYAMENGNFPPNGVAGLHASLQGYVPAKMFGAATVLGGAWDWDYQQDGFTAAVSVYQFTASDAQLIDIDRKIDDGVLTTGMFQKMGSKVIYVIQP
jgi:prepilin-type N-terminal cleavage/methylation domain-containing protein